MGRYKKILVAVDGSESSLHALRGACRLATFEKCWITVVGVVPPYEGDLSLVGVKNVLAAMRQPFEIGLSAAKEIAQQEGALIRPILEEGEPDRVITDLADAENFDLIVMGRRGKHGIEKALVGSVTARVIGFSQRDVLVVPEDATVCLDRILLATDGSKYSNEATDKAIDIARSYGSMLKIVSIIDVPPDFFAEAPDIHDNMIKKAKGFVEDAKDRALSAGVRAEGFIREGTAYKKIIDLAKEQDAHIIIMGSHGRTGLRRLLMGSVAERVTGLAPCPLLIIKP
jgi:nucleotide-binding universal stress UspA family protein